MHVLIQLTPDRSNGGRDRIWRMGGSVTAGQLWIVAWNRAKAGEQTGGLLSRCVVYASRHNVHEAWSSIDVEDPLRATAVAPRYTSFSFLVSVPVRTPTGD